MSLRFILPLLFLSSAAAAQQVTLRGKVEDGPASGQFFVDCTEVALTSSSVNLNAFNGEHVLITGTSNGTPAAPSVNVQTIQVVPEIFEIPGNPEVGQEMRFGATYTPGTRVNFYVSLASGFRPVGPAGTSFLDSAVFATAGVIPQPGNLELEVPMPNDATLIGRTAYAQAALISGGRVLLSNPDCKTIR